jgi:hypothetical protein
MKQLKKKESSMTKKLYKFKVPCCYYYVISANNESQARKILLKNGGINIEGELFFKDNAYKDAKLCTIQHN